MSTTTTGFRTLDTSDRLPDGYVNPYYLDDLKRRVSVARVGGKLYAFDDLCTHEACPLSAGMLTDTPRSCASVTNPSSTSQPDPSNGPRDRTAYNLRGSRTGRQDPDTNLSAASCSLQRDA